ncbi:hypothetical protein H9Q09_00785 [Aurantimonas sp. DM33-3]|uniref:hypothetical protein n=1 Tax=Aurantimonas sp. DM33-3 TaxID=2766955 RepID=UPI001651D07E|nr:hypothetical protein [Aurantimonas sp. DM33-3]MBC6714719.1 hypothetical protein [Aurantimonas sp. DM33-3]
MSYLSERQRVEFGLLPNMLLSILVAGVNDPDHPDAKEAERLLALASVAPVEDLPRKEQVKLLRRIIRLHDEVMAPFRAEGMRTDKAGLIAFYALQAIVESDYMVIVDGGDLSRALDIVLPAIEHAAEIERLDASAQKAARRLLRDLQSRGYFRGVAAPQQQAA